MEDKGKAYNIWYHTCTKRKELYYQEGSANTQQSSKNVVNQLSGGHVDLSIEAAMRTHRLSGDSSDGIYGLFYLGNDEHLDDTDCGS